MTLARIALATVLALASSWAWTYELSLPSVSIAYGSWTVVPMAKYSIDDVRKHPTYRIESENYGFYEYVLEAIAEDQLQACSAKLDERHQIRLVVDVSFEGKAKTFISDGSRLFTADMKRCRLVDDAFKNKFRVGSGVPSQFSQ